jgi:hypothetical protein
MTYGELDKNVLLANLEIAQKRFDGAETRLKNAKSQKLRDHAMSALYTAGSQLYRAKKELNEYNAA